MRTSRRGFAAIPPSGSGCMIAGSPCGRNETGALHEVFASCRAPFSMCSIHYQSIVAHQRLHGDRCACGRSLLSWWCRRVLRDWWSALIRRIGRRHDIFPRCIGGRQGTSRRCLCRCVEERRSICRLRRTRRDARENRARCGSSRVGGFSPDAGEVDVGGASIGVSTTSSVSPV